jgi:DNA-binding NarL/FixJ family response regulator
LLADDQALVRSGFRLILELAEVDVVGEAADGAEAVELARALRPDVVLMDVRMPRMDGIEATRRIGQAGLPTRVLVLTTFDLDEYVYDALRAGASGFLLKDVDRAGLVDAVRTVADGEALMAPSVLERLVTHYVERPPSGVTQPDFLADLSARELEVLKLVGRGLSNGEIAEELVISLATVKTHIRHLFQKLNLRDRVQAVVLAHEHGSRWSERPLVAAERARGEHGREHDERRQQPDPPGHEPQSICSIAAERPATTAQLTGLNLATVPIQSGARLACISAEDRNVSGSSTSVTAPISDSRWRVSTPSPFESEANAAPSRPRRA